MNAKQWYHAEYMGRARSSRRRRRLCSVKLSIMAADVSSLVRVLNRYKEDQHHRTIGNEDESTAPITRDLLGGSFKLPESQELDLELQVPNGYEKRLDLKSGKVTIRRCNTQNSSPSSLENNYNKNQTFHKLQDLNNPPSPSKKSPLNLFDETSLDLKLVSSPSPSQPSSCHYQSVCTLDKVKFALERAEKEPFIKKRTSLCKSSTSPSYSSSSSSIKLETLEDHNTLSLSPVAAGCPGCLLYVLISKNNPKCPRCNSVVPFPKTKKPRIDLNISI